MTDILTSADFDHFFRAVRTDAPAPTATQLRAAPPPFAWQQRLVDELLTERPSGRAGQWPDLLDLPTGSGKTTTIDIALFVLACRDDAPRRIVFVVDRRVVVQQAASWARSLACRLNDALKEPESADPIVVTVARRLAAKSGVVPDPRRNRSARAVVAAELRGGIAADTTWAERPDTPTIITSTVDQVGSRLLMQGYGVSESMRPVHAGLLSNDVLFLLDEVHLSQPFAQTLDAVKKYRRRSSVLVWPGELDRWQVVQLSATPNTTGPNKPIDRFGLIDSDRSGVLGQRLTASKPTSVVAAPKARADADPNAGAVRALAEHALAAAHRAKAPHVIAVVANRVASATAVASWLERAAATQPADQRPEVLLLTGRMRPFDRDRALERHLEQVKTGRNRGALDRHVFLVGTQSIEAGVDFDVDALITQSASLDALKQRFGRVDRRGEVSASGEPSANVIVCASSSRQSASDPVYGDALSQTEAWLLERREVDFGISHLEIGGIAAAPMCSTPKLAPALLPTHLDAWAQNPTPHFAPEVSAWLHGPESAEDPDVAVVWRTGLIDRDGVFVQAILDAIPIRPDETVDVPLSHVRRWLRRVNPDPDLADVEGVSAVAEEGRRRAATRRFRIVTPDGAITPEITESARLSAIKPGDTVLVDVFEGGLTLGTWDPTAAGAVDDLSAIRRQVDPEDVQLPAWQRQAQPVRLDLALAETEAYARGEGPANHVESASMIRAWAGNCPVPVTDPDIPQATSDDIKQWCAAMPDVLRGSIQAAPGSPTTNLRALAALCDAPGEIVLIEIPSEGRWATLVFAPGPGVEQRGPGVDRDSTSTIGVQVELSAHGEDVAQWAQAFLRALRLPEEEVFDHSITVAARYHDIGKADSRFQLQLWEGQVQEALLAKSSIPPEDWRRRRAARASSGYPGGARHELLSAKMLIGSAVLDRPDADLIGHLVASHHGVGRPFASALRRPDVDPPEKTLLIGLTSFTTGEHGMIEVGSPIADWFWRSIRQHGWFGNAWLTALLRLADHEASRYPTPYEAGGAGD